MMPLPDDRPLVTRDLRDALGPIRGKSLYGTLELAHLVGLNMGAWSALVRDARGERPLRLHPTAAIMLRYLEGHPEAMLPPLAVGSPVDLHAALGRAGLQLSKRDLAITLGCEASAGSRWTRQEVARTLPVVRRACALLLAPHDAGETRRRWEAWTVCAAIEARCRGFDGDFPRVATWFAPGEIVMPKPRGSAGYQGALRRRLTIEEAQEAAAAVAA